MADKRNPEAEAAYRAAWLAYRDTYDDTEREALEREMDRLQPLIAAGPLDPRWPSFAESLPGYMEFWEVSWNRMLGKIRDDQED